MEDEEVRDVLKHLDKGVESLNLALDKVEQSNGPLRIDETLNTVATILGDGLREVNVVLESVRKWKIKK